MKTIQGTVRVVLNLTTPPLEDADGAIEEYVNERFGDAVSDVEITDSWVGDMKANFLVFLQKNLTTPKPNWYEVSMSFEWWDNAFGIECVGDHWDGCDMQERSWLVDVAGDGTVTVDSEEIGNLSDGYEALLPLVQGELDSWSPG